MYANCSKLVRYMIGNLLEIRRKESKARAEDGAMRSTRWTKNKAFLLFFFYVNRHVNVDFPYVLWADGSDILMKACLGLCRQWHLCSACANSRMKKSLKQVDAEDTWSTCRFSHVAKWETEAIDVCLDTIDSLVPFASACPHRELLWFVQCGSEWVPQWQSQSS